MRKYSGKTENMELIKVVCNKCGKKLNIKNGIVLEGVFCQQYKWGYFSEKDGIIQSFDLCEKCYDEMIKGFIIPVDEEENNELL